MFEDQNIPVAFLDKKGDAYTTTLVIAEGTGVEHASVIKLVRTYLDDLQEFNLVRFQIRPRLVGSYGGGDLEYAELNEPQATLILTYMRNNEVVREFKKRLVKAFYTLTHQPRNLDTTGPQPIYVVQNCHEGDGEDRLTTTTINSLTSAIEKLTAQLAIANRHNQEATQHPPKKPAPELAFLNAWWDCLADRNITANDLCRIINNQQCLALTQAATALFNLAGKNLTGTKLGTSLRTWSQQDFNGFCILNTGNKAKGSVIWRLERIQ